MPSHIRRAAFALVLQGLLVISGSAAAQAPEQGALHVKVTVAPRREPPSLLPPLYYMLAPGAALLAVGGILWSQRDPTEESAAMQNASILLMSTGATMVVGTVPYLGMRIAKRRRWAAQRRWDACGQNCKLSEPSLYHAAYMLGPGIVMTIAGAWFMVHNWTLIESEGDLPDDPERGYNEPYITLATACALVGTTLAVAGTVHLVARSQLRAAWRKRSGALSRVRVQPTMSMRTGAAANYNVGLVMSAWF
jgi:hypothetical protein